MGILGSKTATHLRSMTKTEVFSFNDFTLLQHWGFHSKPGVFDRLDSYARFGFTVTVGEQRKGASSVSLCSSIYKGVRMTNGASHSAVLSCFPSAGLLYIDGKIRVLERTVYFHDGTDLKHGLC